jgi:glycosyltransferase involved in cell wall biosynthesis
MHVINQPLFSIITPTNKRTLLLKRTIDSVRNQTFKDYEHLIIDDANDLETLNLVTGFGDKKVIYYQHINPKGAAGAYNTGIKISRGKFILFLDDDDEYLPSFLEKMFIHFTHCGKNIGFVWAGISRIRDTDAGEELITSMVWPSKFSTKEEGLVNATSIGNGFGLCIRKKCIDEIGLYDESIILGQDTDYLFRLAGKFDFESIPEVLVKIHQHGSSQLTDKKFYHLRLEFKEEILNRHNNLLIKYPKLFYVHYKTLADLCYILKLKRKGRKTMLAIMKHTPFRIKYIIDILFYELTGKDTAGFYYGRKLNKLFIFNK